MAILSPILRPICGPVLSGVNGVGVNGLTAAIRALFANNEQGAWYDPSDLSTLFQDSAGSTQVTAVGQPVGLMRDKSGRGNHVTQVTTTARPTLQQDAGGRYYLSFDGVDDELAVAKTLTSYSLTLACVVQVATDALGGFLSVYGGSPPYYELGKSASPKTFLSRVRGATTAAIDVTAIASSLTAPNVLLGSYSDTSVGLRVNGASAVSKTNNNAFGTTTKFRVGNGGLNGIAHAFYGGIILTRAMSSDEIYRAERYLAGKAGVITPAWESSLSSLKGFVAASYNQPNPHNQGAMAQPPLITVADETSDASLSQIHAYADHTDQNVFYAGGGNLPFSTVYRCFPAATFGATGGNLGSGYQATAWRARIQTNAKKVQFSLTDTGIYRFLVNGQYVDLFGSASAGTGGRCYFAMQFMDNASRKIGVEGIKTGGFENIQVAPTDTFSMVTRNNRRIIFFGDSFTDGQGAALVGDAYSYIAGDNLGFEDIVSSGAGGTGYVRPASAVKFGDRLQDINSTAPWDVIVIAGGINDFGYSGITDNVLSVMQRVRTANPSAQIFVVGPWDNLAPASPQPDYAATKSAILAGIPTNYGIRFIDAQGVPYEKIEDGVHPTTNGHRTIGLWLADQIKTALGA